MRKTCNMTCTEHIEEGRRRETGDGRRMSDVKEDGRPETEDGRRKFKILFQ